MLGYRPAIWSSHGCTALCTSLQPPSVPTAPHRRGRFGHVIRSLSLALFVAGLHARMSIGSHLMKYGWKCHCPFYFLLLFSCIHRQGGRDFWTWCVCEEQTVLAFLFQSDLRCCVIKGVRQHKVYFCVVGGVFFHSSHSS